MTINRKDEKMTIGEKINELRKEKNMTLLELSKKSGVSAVTLTHWKLGRTKPQMVALNKVAIALGRDLADLYPYLKNE